MIEIKWGPALEIGVAAMDEQHRGIIAAMHEVQQLDARAATKVQLEQALGRLLTVTKRHFADEERYMETTGYVDLKRHQAIHRDLLARLDGYGAAFAHGDGRLPEGFLQFLVYWLSAHIKGIDKKYAPAPAKAR